MCEESISSSPCKSKKSIRKLRFTRRSKQKGQVITDPDIQKIKMSNRLLLQHLYYDSDEETPKPGDLKSTTTMENSLVTGFKPFQIEKHLCYTKLVNSVNVPMPETSGFLPCITTLERESNEKVFVIDDSSHIITDSELLSCLKQVDEMLFSTPRKSLRLVNSILEDFALSPYTEKSKENAKFLEYSPEFVLKSKPRITYSARRRNAQRADCNKRLDFISNDEWPDDSFVPENLSEVAEYTSTTTVAPQTKERLCENLLNLSAYYTQTSTALDEEIPNVLSVEIKENIETMDLCPSFRNVVSILQEITSLRETLVDRLRNGDSYSSCEDFYGFPEESIGPYTENKTTLLDNRCDILDVELLSPMCSQKVEANKGDQFDDWDEDYTEIFAFIKTPPHSSRKDGRSNFVSVEGQSKDRLCLAFKTASSKPIHISKEAKSKAGEMLKNLPELGPKQAVNRDILKDACMRERYNIGINDSEIVNPTSKYSEINCAYDQPSTSKAALQANREYERRRNIIEGKRETFSEKTRESVEKYFNEINEFHPDKGFDLDKVKDGINERNILKSNNTWQKDSNVSTGPLFLNTNEHIQKQLGKLDNRIGFQTANGKNIKPTSKALKSVEKLLTEFQTDLKQFDENDLEIMKNKINQKQCKQSTSDTKELIVKENERLWAETDLANVFFSEWPLEQALIAQSSQGHTLKVNFENKQTSVENNTLKAELTGFHTAGGKKVSISDKGKKFAENLLDKIKNDDADDLLDIKNSIHKKNNKTVVVHKPTIVQNDSALGLKDISANEEPVDYCSKAEYQPVHATKTCTNNTTNSFTELSVKSSLNIPVAGFQTAGGKKLLISEKGKKIAENLLQKIKNDCDTTDLLEIKNSIHKKNNKTVVVHKPTIVQNDSELGLKDFSANEEPVHYCSKAEYQPVHAAKTCTNKTTNSFTELSVKSPLNRSVANSIIARKNLLSLSRKRRKVSSLTSPARETNDNALPGELKEHPSDYEDTPNDIQSFTNNTTHVVQSPSTPNGSGLYLNAWKCSTPRSELRVTSTRNMDDDDDFKPISCNNNKSMAGACSNITFNSPNPSVNDRLARLRMYGEAPPISPILKNFQNNCRSSGLKRTRSMLNKKAEDK